MGFRRSGADRTGGSFEDVVARLRRSDGSASSETRWADCGAMWLTGRGSGSPLLVEAPLARRMQSAQTVLAEVSEAATGHRVTLDVAALLGERAAIAGLSRHGSVSAGGTARLLPAGDGWIAVNLARPSDLELLPAWLGCERAPVDADAAWPMVKDALATHGGEALVERGQLLAIPVAMVPAHGAEPDVQLVARGQEVVQQPWLVSGRLGDRSRKDERPIVVDLSSLWSGPLCANVLGLAGLRVVKVECVTRPDGARSGPRRFFDLLHAGHESVALDFTTVDGRRALLALVLHADVVIESSRPRALEQLGVDLADVRRRRPDITWVSITAYGRQGPWANRVGFGDDTAAAAGLVADDGGGLVWCADAIADPVAGAYAAIGTLTSLARGGGCLIDVSLREAARFASGDVVTPRAVPGGIHVSRPRHRPVCLSAQALGADTRSVLQEVGDRP